MSAQSDIRAYILSSRQKGFSDEAIRIALTKAGWKLRDINRAFDPAATNTPAISPGMILASIVLFLVFGGGAAWGMYQYQTQPGVTPSPPPSIPITATPTLQPTLNASPSGIPQSAAVSGDSFSEVSFAHNAFGFSVFSQLSKSTQSANVVISPTSISLALSMTYNGASQSTQLAMKNTMKLNGLDTQMLNVQSGNLMRYLTNPDPQVTLTFANSIWTRKGLTVLPAFLSINKSYYNAQIQSLDFSLPSAKDTINSWVNKETKGKIATIIDGEIDRDVVMYLINALYFYGAWTWEFDPAMTAMKAFSVSPSKTVQHLFMKQTRKDYLYQETPLFQAVQLPYGKSRRLAMVVFLPKTTLSAFLGQLTHTTWNSWMKSFDEMEGTVILPKFKIDYKTSLRNTLLTLGMVPAFSSETADFSLMRKQKDLFISDVLHKTFIDVNEKGTEAAAVTAVVMSKTMAEPDTTFTMDINKPFFFTIYDTQSGEILFLGTVTNPKE